MIGETLGHYRVIEQIGAGGMGVVYRARDERLERDVALKVLPSQRVADETARKDLRKEALALSKLNHPNIATIYDFGTEGDVDFFAMEYVTGQTLADRLSGAPVAEKEILALGSQIANALEEAHEHGIVHRDLKPRNVIVTPKGRVKVLDFGLAKWLHPSGAITVETVTLIAGAAGTLPYMAPEQLLGEEIDGRADIFSFGVVLYELATRRRPFPEENVSRLMTAILSQPPVPPRAVNSRMSAELERIILKCLEKDPEHRYQSAKEILADLRRIEAGISGTVPLSPAGVPRRTGILGWIAGGALLALVVAGAALYVNTQRGGQIDSLAVLPFTDAKSDPAVEYLDDGLTESLIDELSQLPNFKVMSRSAVFRFKGKEVDAQTAGKALGVKAVLTGRIQELGETINVSTELVNAADNSHIWGGHYVRKMADLSSLQEDISRDISEQLRLRLTKSEQAQLGSHTTHDAEAYQLYLKGRFYWEKKTEADLWRAIGYFQQAIEKDPHYALADVGLSGSYAMLPLNGSVRPSDAYPKAKEAALGALAVDPGLGDTHAAYARLLFDYDRNYVLAGREFQEALRLSPNALDVHTPYAERLSVQGRNEEAIAEFKRALEIDPFCVACSGLLGRTYQFARRYQESEDQLRKTLEMNANFWPTYVWLGVTLALKKEYPEAIEELRKAGNVTQEPFSTIAYVHAISGQREEGRKELNQLLEVSKHQYVRGSLVARVYVGLGEKEKAIDWLERADEERDFELMFIKVDPVYDSLRGEARFQDLVRKIGLPD